MQAPGTTIPAPRTSPKRAPIPCNQGIQRNSRISPKASTKRTQSGKKRKESESAKLATSRLKKYFRGLDVQTEDVTNQSQGSSQQICAQDQLWRKRKASDPTDDPA